MLVLRVEHHKTFIQNASNDDLELVREALTVFKKKYKASQYSKDEWEVTYLLDIKNFSFPTAYLTEVQKFAEEKFIKVELIDNRRYPYHSLPKLNIRKELSLRDDQKEAFAAIKEHRTGIVMMPTASGKSRIITKTIDYRKVRTLIVVPKTNLQTQLANQLKEVFGPSKVDTQMPWELKDRIKNGFFETDEDNQFEENHVLRKKKFKLDEELYTVKVKTPKKSYFDEVTTTKPNKIKFSLDMDALGKKEEVDPEAAYLKDKNHKRFQKKIQKQKERWEEQKKTPIKDRPIKYKDIYVICDASLANLPLEFLNQFQMIIIDECHHAAAKLIREALLKMKNAAYRYFFSATPWRDHSAEQKLLISSIGTNVIFELSPEDAIANNSVAKPVYEMVRSPEMKNFINEKAKWREILETCIIGNATRNQRIVDLALADYDADKNVFIAVDEIAHLEILKERFKALGIDADVIHGEQPRKVNEEAIARVGERTKGICIGTMSVGEGTDMPNIDSVYLASGGKSSIRFLQRIGRGARKGTNQDKVLFKVTDFFDWFHPTLIRHSAKRKSIFEKYYKENFE